MIEEDDTTIPGLYILIDSLLAARGVSTSGAEPTLREDCFLPLLAQATNVTAGTERTAASGETSIIVGQRLHWETLATLPRKGLASELSAACCLRRGFSECAGASRGFVPNGASWFLALPLFLGRKPLCGCLLCSWRLLPFTIGSASLPLPCGLADPFSLLLWYCGLNLRLWLEEPFYQKKKKEQR